MTKEEAIKAIKSHCYFANLVPAGKEALDMAIKALEQEPNTWSLDDAREDFMHDVYNTLDFLPTNNEANRIIDSFDRVTKCIEQESCGDAVSRKDIYFKLTNGAYPNETIEQFIDRLVKELNTLRQVCWRHRKHSIPLDKVKQAREEISDWDVNKVMDGCSEPFKLGVAKGLDIASVILDKLIESDGKK